MNLYDSDVLSHPMLFTFEIHTSRGEDTSLVYLLNGHESQEKLSWTQGSRR